VSHPFRVCLAVSALYGVDDPETLAAALLHDTLEDTTTDYDDLEKAFGAKVASFVALLSKDNRFPEEERERRYRETLSHAPDPVRFVKLADIRDNLSDRAAFGHKPLFSRTVRRARSYIDAMKTGGGARIIEECERVSNWIRGLETEVCDPEGE
jgi:guanosine-3',5'-bis(diphosphate) 3'-pyrophosphohydrolase